MYLPKPPCNASNFKTPSTWFDQSVFPNFYYKCPYLTVYRLMKTAHTATKSKIPAFRYSALESAAFAWTADGELVELGVGLGVISRVEFAVLLPALPVPIEIVVCAEPIMEGFIVKAVTVVLFETASADLLLEITCIQSERKLTTAEEEG
jgi:hypothetical protein